MMAITVIATIVPGINAVDFSKIMQKRVITRFIENGMPDSTEGRERLTGAYDYLKYEYGKNYISSFLSNELQEEIIAMDPDGIERGSKSYDVIEYHVTGYILMNQEYIDGLHN